MNNLPFLVKIHSVPARAMDCLRDEIVCEEPLPAALTMTAMGLVHNRSSMVTDVKQETTDDK